MTIFTEDPKFEGFEMVYKDSPEDMTEEERKAMDAQFGPDTPEFQEILRKIEAGEHLEL